MYKDIGTAIMTAFNADDSLSKRLTGGLFHHTAPDNVSSPYGVFRFMDLDREEWMGSASNAIKKVTVQISIYTMADDGGVEISELIALVDSCYSWASLTISGYTHVATEPIGQGPVLFEDNIWQGMARYELQFI